MSESQFAAPGVAFLRLRRAALGTVSTAALVSALCVSAPAHAQTAEQSAQATAQTPQVEEVVVSASRIVQSGFEAPTPVTVMSAAELQEQGTTNITNMLNQLPAVQPTATNASNSQNSGGKYINLRGLGSNRNLVLVDGRRFVATRPDNSVDANVIPATLVERVDVVTGGASAAWGSDAVSGVVNMILKTNLEGFDGNLQTSVSQRGDEFEYSGSLAWGSSFANDRGHFMIAGEEVNNNGIDPRSSRSWAQAQWALVANPAYAPGNGQYRLISAPNATQPYATGTGNAVIVSGPLKGIAFAPDGTPIKYNYGTAVGSAYMIGGDGFYMGKSLIMTPPSDRQNAFSRITYDVSDDTRVFVEGSYVRSWAHSVVVYKYDNSLPIARDNAFLPASVAAQMASLKLTSISIGRVDLDLPRDDVYTTNTARRVATGANGSIGNTGWTWDAYYQYGMNKYDDKLPSDRVEANFRSAVDSVFGPGGTIVCRSSLTNPGNGCVPYNPFVVGPKDDSVIRYVTADAYQIIDLSQHVAAANVHGNLFTTDAGPVSFASGIEWRREEIYGISDPISQAGGFRLGNQKAIAGAYSVKEAYAETVVPLLKDHPFAKLVELNAAVRVTDYTTSGTVETWKIGGNYQPIDELRFRSTYSRDIRAPSVSDLFTTANIGTGTIIDRTNNLQTSNTATVRRGNPLLNPEKADSFTGGVVYQPEWFKGFRASVDYYDIRIKDAIGSISGQNIVDRCFNGATSLCSLITRDARGVITSIDAPTLNLSKLSTNGLDFEADYGFSLDSIIPSVPGDVTFRVLATYLNSYVTDDGVTVVESAGDDGASLPHWRGFGSVTYTNGPWDWFLSARYVGGGTLSNTYGPQDIANNNVKGRIYFDSSISFDVYKNASASAQLYLRIQNILDAEPPIMASSATNATVTNDTLFDPVGRAFAVGVRFKY